MISGRHLDLVVVTVTEMVNKIQPNQKIVFQSVVS